MWASPPPQSPGRRSCPPIGRSAARAGPRTRTMGRCGMSTSPQLVQCSARATTSSRRASGAPSSIAPWLPAAGGAFAAAGTSPARTGRACGPSRNTSSMSSRQPIARSGVRCSRCVRQPRSMGSRCTASRSLACIPSIRMRIGAAPKISCAIGRSLPTATSSTSEASCAPRCRARCTTSRGWRAPRSGSSASTPRWVASAGIRVTTTRRPPPSGSTGSPIAYIGRPERAASVTPECCSRSPTGDRSSRWRSRRSCSCAGWGSLSRGCRCPCRRRRVGTSGSTSRLMRRMPSTNVTAKRSTPTRRCGRGEPSSRCCSPRSSARTGCAARRDPCCPRGAPRELRSGTARQASVPVVAETPPSARAIAGALATNRRARRNRREGRRDLVGGGGVAYSGRSQRPLVSVCA